MKAAQKKKPKAPDENDRAIAGQLPADPAADASASTADKAARAGAALDRALRAGPLTPERVDAIERVIAPLIRVVSAPDDASFACALGEVQKAAARAATPDDGPANDAAPPAPLSPLDVIARWREEGPLVRVQTGIEPLDRACRGGLPIPWRMILVGAPSAGKTYVETVIADALARAADAAGLCVGVLAVDEDPEDLTLRLAQIAGFRVEDAEARDPEVLGDMAEALRLLRIRLYPSRWTIDAAANDLAARAAVDGRRAALFVDSAQTARSDASVKLKDPSLRQEVEANTAAIRSAAERHRMLVIATSEANRAAYRGNDVDEQNDMAAGAESRTLEYSAQTQLVLRTPKGYPDVIHVRVAKNRRHTRGVEFWLRMERDSHRLIECPDPTLDPTSAAKSEERQRAGVRAQLAADADDLIGVLHHHPSGVGEKALRADIAGAGLRWGVDRLEAAKRVVEKGHGGVRLVDRGPGRKGAPKLWCLVPDTADTTHPAGAAP